MKTKKTMMNHSAPHHQRPVWMLFFAVIALACIQALSVFAAETITYSYDAAGRLTAARFHDATTNAIDYAYDANGNLTQRVVRADGPPTPTPEIGLSGHLAFGHVTTNMTATRTLTIHEISGAASLTVSNITYPPEFSGPWSGTIPAGDSHSIDVHFQPMAVESCDGTITVLCDATNGGHTISCSGRGTAWAIDPAYRSEYSLPTDGSEDFIDSDGDQFTNWEEWLAGTNPTNRESLFRAEEPVYGQDVFTFAWPSRTGRIYRVMVSTNLLAEPPDTPFLIITGQVEKTTCTDTNAKGPSRFYWVEIETD
jgi:YD repeat-containing protein